MISFVHESTPSTANTYYEMANDQPKSHLEHLARLSTTSATGQMRKTSIVCTIGPSCNDIPALHQLILNGMTIARINFSHGTPEEHREAIRKVKAARRSLLDYYVAIALDTKGPEIRTGPNKGGKPIHLVEGQHILVSVDESNKLECTDEQIFVTYAKIEVQLYEGDDMYIDDGVICLRVQKKSDEGLECVVLSGGLLVDRKGVNLPSCHVDLPIISDRDRDDLRLGVEEGVDMIFASYTRDKEEVEEVKDTLKQFGGDSVLVLAKIENRDGVRNIDEIVEAADGILIARGPLGVETPSSKVALVQKSIISKCIRACRPVIVATQMLESMCVHPRATRAECSDVANAVLDGADCVMLSAETACGAFPIQAVHMMNKICREAEAAYFHYRLLEETRHSSASLTPLEAIALAASTAVTAMHASAIVLVTTSGKSAELCSKFRPPVPIVTLCRTARLARQLQLYRGILPFYYQGLALPNSSEETVEESLRIGVEAGKRRGFIRRGEPVVLLTGWPNDKNGVHSMLQLVFAE